MRKDLEKFVRDTQRNHSGRMKKPADLFSRRLSAREWVDSAVIGGATLEDVLNGRVTDADLDPKVIEAFHRQYPGLESFSERARDMADDPERLRGLVSGVKGKLFEVKYTDYLNDGHLPAGYTAELAEAANQPGYDVVIRDGLGNVADKLQVKASADIDYIEQTIDRYPEFDVVVPTDVFGDIAAGSELAGYAMDGGVDLDGLEGAVGGAADAASAAGGLDVVPEIAFLFVGASAVLSLAKGRDVSAVMADTKRRAVKAAVAGGLGGMTAWLLGPWVGVPVSIGTSLLMSKAQSAAEVAEACRERQQRVKKVASAVRRRPGDCRVRYLDPRQIHLLSE